MPVEAYLYLPNEFERPEYGYRFNAGSQYKAYVIAETSVPDEDPLYACGGGNESTIFTLD